MKQANQTAGAIIEGRAVPLQIANCDTDQIMPKQFLRGIDKAGLDQGVFHDLRHAHDGTPRADFVLNQPKYAGASIILAGANFGCGSSREHAVWGLQQAGIKAVVAPSFGEIFYSNAMNNGLMLAMVSEADMQAMMASALRSEEALAVRIDVARLRVESDAGSAPFSLSARHQQMFMQGLDMLGVSLQHLEAIKRFAAEHRARHPWMADVAQRMHERVHQG